jgi:hypothetical protein
MATEILASPLQMIKTEQQDNQFTFTISHNKISLLLAGLHFTSNMQAIFSL